ncbi:hypothetical protein Tco_0050217, partial [Tanacetum coccineum]
LLFMLSGAMAQAIAPKSAVTYVVPTGRVIVTDSVIVATSGYVVPAAYDISPGRVK